MEQANSKVQIHGKVSHEGKRRGGGFIEALRKLTPPKRTASRSSSGNSTSTRSRTSSENLESPFFSPTAEEQIFFPDKIETESSNVAIATSKHVTSAPPASFSMFCCPAQNCPLKLSRDEVVNHTKERHCLVTSDEPEFHSNSVEVSEDDMVQGEGAAAWAPTLLTGFNHTFFFETWRNAGGQWFMWVYNLGDEDESQMYLADIVVEKGVYKATYSGPVFTLLWTQAKVTSSGRCLSFNDDLAKLLLQSLPDGATGINYSVRIRKRLTEK